MLHAGPGLGTRDLWSISLGLGPGRNNRGIWYQKAQVQVGFELTSFLQPHKGSITFRNTQLGLSHFEVQYPFGGCFLVGHQRETICFGGSMKKDWQIQRRSQPPRSNLGAWLFKFARSMSMPKPGRGTMVVVGSKFIVGARPSEAGIFEPCEDLFQAVDISGVVRYPMELREWVVSWCFPSPNLNTGTLIGFARLLRLVSKCAICLERRLSSRNGCAWIQTKPVQVKGPPRLSGAIVAGFDCMLNECSERTKEPVWFEGLSFC